MLDPHLTIELNGREIVYLCDAIKNGTVSEGIGEKDSFLPVGRECLLILAGPFLEVCQGDYDKIIPLVVNEEFCWTVRNVVGFGSMSVDKQPIGPRLLAKVYKLLLEFKHEFDLEDLYAAASPSDYTYEGTIRIPRGRTGLGDGPGENLSGSVRQGDQDINTFSTVEEYQEYCYED